MASVRQDRGGLMPGFVPGRKSIAVLVAALAVVLVAIAMISNVSRRQAGPAPAVAEDVTPTEAPPAAPGPEPEPAVSPAPPDEGAAAPRRRAAIARAVADGRPGLAACYQRALVKDDSLVHGKVTVRVSIARSGRVETVGVHGPAEFRAMQPCLQKSITRWDFPAAPAAYRAEFPLVLQGSL
jgi:outer membrane biosynthesis protein TonB